MVTPLAAYSLNLATVPIVSVFMPLLPICQQIESDKLSLTAHLAGCLTVRRDDARATTALSLYEGD